MADRSRTIADAGENTGRISPISSAKNGVGTLQVGPENSVLGPENHLAGVACQRFRTSTNSNERSAAQPLFIYGPVATGKSLIANGLVQEWNDAHPDQPALVCSGADFARMFALAADAHELTILRERFQTVGLFVLDGLEQIANKPAAQRELRFALDMLFTHDGLAIVTARSLPSHIAKLSPRLAGRLLGGLTAPLVAPDAQARVEIMRQFATQREVKLLPAMIKTLGDAIHGTAPELQSAVIELSAQAKLEQTEITPMLVRKYLASRTAAEPPSLRTIAAITAKYFQLKVTELRSPSRRRAIVTARGIAIYLARELTGVSLEKVGVAFGGRDHTTILHSFRTTADRLRSDAGLRRTLDDLRRLIALS